MKSTRATKKILVILFVRDILKKGEMTMAKFDIGDTVWSERFGDGIVRRAEPDEDMEIFIQPTNNDINDVYWKEDELMLVRPAKWRVGDVLDDACIVSDVYEQPDALGFVACCDDVGEIWPPGESCYSLTCREGTPIYGQQTNKQSVKKGLCPECKDRGHIILFSSIVSCSFGCKSAGNKSDRKAN